MTGMKAALGLYRSRGFRPIPADYANPSPSVMFLELKL